jgi:hypothetical protein
MLTDFLHFDDVAVTRHWHDQAGWLCRPTRAQLVEMALQSQ